MKESIEAKKKRAQAIMTILRKAYPDAKCALDFSTPLELLVATILSAQCTDAMVNKVTPALFKRYQSAKEYSEANPEELQKLIHSTGFYKNKAKTILGMARELVERFGGEVPSRQEDLVTLPGVGRKTANVVLGNHFGIPGLTVDTHMTRLNQLLRFSKSKDPVKIEFDLMKIIPQEEWTNYSHWIIYHGRKRCVARRPDCANCEIQVLCPSGNSLKLSRKLED